MASAYINAALRFTGVEVVVGIHENAYDEDTNTIYLNAMDRAGLLTGFRKILGRGTHKDFGLAHELGHAVFAKLKIGRRKDFKKLFGDADEYRGGTLSFLLSAIVGDTDQTLTRYGSADIEEDFADCFAHMALNGNRPFPHRSDLVMEKQRYVQKILAKVRKLA